MNDWNRCLVCNAERGLDDAFQIRSVVMSEDGMIVTPPLCANHKDRVIVSTSLNSRVLNSLTDELASTRSQLTALHGENKLLAQQLQGKIDSVNLPCKEILDLLWREIVLARKPDYGTWDYPGMAGRHLLVEIKEMIQEQADDGLVRGRELASSQVKLYEEEPNEKG